MSFFEAPPWPSSAGDAGACHGPSRGVMPAIAHLDEQPLILGASDRGRGAARPAVCVAQLRAYPADLFSRGEFIGDHAHRRWGQGPWPPDDALHFGVQFDTTAGALRVGNLGLPPLSANPDSGLIQGGCGSGLGTFHWDYWLWPLTDTGTVTLACAWPANGIGETLTEIDTGPLLAAADRTRTLWE